MLDKKSSGARSQRNTDDVRKLREDLAIFTKDMRMEWLEINTIRNFESEIKLNT